jgi:hypothetical protein
VQAPDGRRSFLNQRAIDRTGDTFDSRSNLRTSVGSMVPYVSAPRFADLASGVALLYPDVGEFMHTWVLDRRPLLPPPGGVIPSLASEVA